MEGDLNYFHLGITVPQQRVARSPPDVFHYLGTLASTTKKMQVIFQSLAPGANSVELSFGLSDISDEQEQKLPCAGSMLKSQGED